MDIEKLIEAVRLCGSTPTVDQCKQCAYWAGGDMSRCIPNMTGDAATALSTLQAENEKLRAELEQTKLEKETLCGDGDIWGFPAIAMWDTEIHKGDRICQFRIVKRQPPVHFVQVESLGNANRGGFGSTGA